MPAARWISTLVRFPAKRCRYFDMPIRQRHGRSQAQLRVIAGEKIFHDAISRYQRKLDQRRRAAHKKRASRRLYFRLRHYRAAAAHFTRHVVAARTHAELPAEAGSAAFSI